MVHFNQLSITPDGKHMIVDVSVLERDFLKDVYLDEIIVDAGDTYTQGGPSKKPYLVRKFRWEDDTTKYKKCCALKVNNALVILKCGHIYKYTGNEIKPDIIVLLGGETLRKDVDYTVEYSNNVNIGLGTIKIIGKGQFSGERTKVFDIVDFDDLSIQNCKIVVEHTYYKKDSTNQIKPNVSVFNGDSLLVKDVHYSLSYGDNNEVGDGFVVITGIGDYKKSRKVVFKIVDTLPEINIPITIDGKNTSTNTNTDTTPNTTTPSTTTDCGCEDIKADPNFDPKNVKIKNARVIIHWQDLIPHLYNHMFFVYVKTKGNPSPDAPCGQDNIYTLGVTVNLFPVYYSFICALRELNDDCKIPKHVIDMYLRYFAFNINAKTGHYVNAIKIWYKWFYTLTHNHNMKEHIGMMADIYPNHSFTHGHHPIPHIEPHHHHYHHHVHDYQAHDHGIDYNHHHHNHYDEWFGGPFGGNVGFFPPMPPIGGCNCGH